jgi:hypothetical protein
MVAKLTEGTMGLLAGDVSIGVPLQIEEAVCAHDMVACAERCHTDIQCDSPCPASLLPPPHPSPHLKPTPHCAMTAAVVMSPPG